MADTITQPAKPALTPAQIETYAEKFYAPAIALARQLAARHHVRDIEECESIAGVALFDALRSGKSGFSEAQDWARCAARIKDRITDALIAQGRHDNNECNLSPKEFSKKVREIC
jgi:hypothetical protein